MDALILSKVPDSVWMRTEAAIIDVTALPETDVSDVDTLLGKIANFEFVSWHANKSAKMEMAEIRQFWLSKSERHKNLYLWRSA